MLLLLLELLDERGIKPIESILMQTGGWPIAMDDEEWNSDEYDWQTIERHYSHLTGWHSFYKIVARSIHGPKNYGDVKV